MSVTKEKQKQNNSIIPEYTEYNKSTFWNKGKKRTTVQGKLFIGHEKQKNTFCRKQ